MSTLLVNVGGIVLMVLVVWWFWLWPRQRTLAAQGGIDITVANGVYTPDSIEMKRGETLTLRFHREDASPCAERVVFHGLDVDEGLPVGKVKTLRIAPQVAGTYRFTCQMQMYQGELRVVD